MKKKILITVGITILFLGTCITPSIAIDNVKKSPLSIGSGDTLYVGGTGEGNYTTIQDAIDDASNGDTVFVYDGAYYENIVIDKSISLLGEDRDTTIIDGSKTDSVIQFTANRVMISEFTIQNSGNDKLEHNAGISTDGYELNNNEISNNIIINNLAGIELFGTNNRICNNTIKRNKGAGIYFGFSNNIVDGNTIKLNLFGIIMDYGDNNNICNNDISLSKTGFIIEDSFYNNVYQNNISKNYNIGLLIISNFFSPRDNNIYLNNIINNIYGICLSGSYIHSGPRRNKIFQNNIMNNFRGAVIDLFSHNNKIYHNNFINNIVNARDWNSSGNYWDNDSKGNYWDKYRGKDNDGDGIGDRPFRLPPFITGNKDKYPLMEPYEDVPDVTIKAINNIPRPRVLSYLWYEWLLERFPILNKMIYIFII